MNDLGEKLWRLREQRGLSQEEFAEMLGVSRQTVSNWENGKATPDALRLGKICAVLRVSADELLGLSSKLSPAESPQENRAQGLRSKWRWLIPLIAAAVFFAVAAVWVALCAAGTIPSGQTSSVFIFTNTAVFYVFLALGVGSLVAAFLLYLKKK